MPATAVNSVQYRQERRQELLSRGWSVEMLDNASQPKVDYYRHKPRMTVSGKVAQSRPGSNGPVGDVGKLIPNQPADPDTAMMLSSQGVLPWPPSDTCECKACREEYGTEKTGKHFMAPSKVASLASSNFASPIENDAATGAAVQVKTEFGETSPTTYRCPDCDFVPRRGKSPALSLRAHQQHKHKG